MMDKIKRFMLGRYGNDQLNLAIVIVGCLLTIFLSFLNNPYIRYIGLIPYILAAVRFFSKDRAKRQQENMKFLKFIAPYQKIAITKLTQLQDKDHRYYACPQCRRTLRVPKGRGKIKISCPHCGKEFIKKT